MHDKDNSMRRLEARGYLASLRSLGLTVDEKRSRAEEIILASGRERFTLAASRYGLQREDGTLELVPGIRFSRISQDIGFDRSFASIWKTMSWLLIDRLRTDLGWEGVEELPSTLGEISALIPTLGEDNADSLAMNLGVDAPVLSSWLLAFSEVERHVEAFSPLGDLRLTRMAEWGDEEILGRWNSIRTGLWNVALAFDYLMSRSESHFDLSLLSWLEELAEDYRISGDRIGRPLLLC